MYECEPQPWTHAECGQRLLWRASAVHCPDHGQVARLFPSMPSDDDDARRAIADAAW